MPERRQAPQLKTLSGRQFEWAGSAIQKAVGIVAVAALLVYGLSNPMRTDLTLLVCSFAILGLSVYIPLRFAGSITLAITGYMGIGAYAYGYLANHEQPALGVLAGIMVSGLVGFVTSAATTRLQGYFLAVTTLLASVAFGRFFLTADWLTGGPIGLSFPTEFYGASLTPETVMVIAGVWLLIMMLLVDRFGVTPIGKALLVMSKHEQAAEAVGVDPLRARIVVLTLSAGLSSTAGALLAAGRGFVLPTSFDLDTAFLALFIPILGGMGTSWGSVVGALVVVNVMQYASDFGPGQLIFGLAVLFNLLVFRGGVLGALQLVVVEPLVRVGSGALARRVGPASPESVAFAAESRAAAAAPPVDAPESGRVVLRADSISVSFGGIRALTDVAFALHPGDILGIVGPNGAGKSTLINVLTGHQRPLSGLVELEGSPMGRTRPAARARRGMARTFQHPKLAGNMSVFDNVHPGLLRIARLRGSGGQRHVSRREAVSEARLRCVSLGIPNSHEMTDDVSYGTQKLTEVARALGAPASVLLLDEPFAGLSDAEIKAMLPLLTDLSQAGTAIILVDHNVDVVRQVCTRMIVLANGRVIAEGTADDVLSQPSVREAYFGEVHA